ncbi:hypothetical protein TNCV_425041 [Trichonephila clavipes]|nr:hypothetical protein TNCV_425041 [Trichonephila clavipes]
MWQDQYKDVLQNRLIPQQEEWFPNGEPYIFMRDGAPCHTARSSKLFWQAGFREKVNRKQPILQHRYGGFVLFLTKKRVDINGSATQRLLETNLEILNHGQVTRSTPDLTPFS